VTTGSLVTPRLGLAVGADHTHYAALPAPPPTPLPLAPALGPIGEGMRAAVTGGTATRLADLPTPVGAKTGTAQDGVLPEGTYDNWMTAAVPIRAPSLVMTAMVQGPGLGANNAGVVGHDALGYYLAHQPEILASAPVRAGSTAAAALPAGSRPPKPRGRPEMRESATLGCSGSAPGDTNDRVRDRPGNGEHRDPVTSTRRSCCTGRRRCCSRRSVGRRAVRAAGHDAREVVGRSPVGVRCARRGTG
jgi:membrane peptidoglycan carboxypeptidase